MRDETEPNLKWRNWEEDRDRMEFVSVYRSQTVDLLRPWPEDSKEDDGTGFITASEAGKTDKSWK